MSISQSNDPLYTVFFSANNIEWLQKNIRNGVWKMSKGKYNVGNQDENSLLIVMHHALENIPSIQGERIHFYHRLNEIVLSYCIPNVYNNLINYINYYNDINTLKVPMKHPVEVRESKTLEFKQWF